jgi:hypothetical protein
MTRTEMTAYQEGRIACLEGKDDWNPYLTTAQRETVGTALDPLRNTWSPEAEAWASGYFDCEEEEQAKAGWFDCDAN